MKATEAKIKAVWNSIPEVIRLRILDAVKDGKLYTYTYKSVTPAAFKDIDTTLLKLELLGYTTEYGKVDIAEDNDAVGISTDTKLTIRW